MRGKGLPVPGATTMRATGGELVMAQAKAAGSEYLFTNPGSFEVGFFDAQPGSGIPLIMGLHEGIVISMADGYHRTSLKPAFVNLHVVAGTAQAVGQLYNASRDGSALVVTAGMLDNEIWSDEGMLAQRPGFDQKEVARPFTKISWECREPQSLPLMLRRAYKVAATEPGGPVYLAMVNYALEAKNVQAQILPAERFLFRSRVRPEAAAVEEAVKLLLAAKRPLLVAGDEVWKSGAQADLVAFADKFGLPGRTRTGRLSQLPVAAPDAFGIVQRRLGIHQEGRRPDRDGGRARFRRARSTHHARGARGGTHRPHRSRHVAHGPQLSDGPGAGGAT